MDSVRPQRYVVVSDGNTCGQVQHHVMILVGNVHRVARILIEYIYIPCLV